MTDVERWPPSPQPSRPNVNYGDHDLALNNEILRTLVGSGVHGIAIDGTDDRDEMGVFIEPPEHVIGGKGTYDTHQWRTQPEGARSGPGDVDLTIYSLRKYLKLATRGNPTILLPLFNDALALVRASRAKLERIIDEGRSPLPPGPDWAAVDGWAIGAHRRHWGWA